MSTSTTKAKYIALGHVARDIVEIQRYIDELDLSVAMVESITLHGNNEMSIALTKNSKSQHQTKHIDVEYHYI